jgi:hypothetical protein
MIDAAFLSHFPDPFDTKNSRYLLMLANNEKIEVSARELSDLEQAVVTYEAGSLVDDLRRAGVSPPVGLININDSLRLIAGVARDEGG